MRKILYLVIVLLAMSGKAYAFTDINNCHMVAHIKAHTFRAVGYNNAGELAPIDYYNASKTVWICDDGGEYLE